MADDDVPTPDEAPASDPASDPAAAEAASAALRRVTRSTPRATAKRSRRPAPGPSRDPEPIGQAMERLVDEQGWRDESSVAVLMSEWDQIVGADLAAHVRAVSFSDGELVLQAESTAWATQVRLLLPQVHRAVDDRVGAGVVRAIRVRGPQGPTWAAGPRRVKGRGPRDTYG